MEKQKYACNGSADFHKLHSICIDIKSILKFKLYSAPYMNCSNFQLHQVKIIVDDYTEVRVDSALAVL